MRTFYHNMIGILWKKSVVAIAVLFFFIACADEPIKFISQDSNSRTLMDSLDFEWKKVELSSPYRPAFIEADPGNCLYIFDYAVFRVMKSCGADTTKFSIAKGKGPGELINPVDMFIHDSLLIFVDPPNGKVSFYTFQGEYKKEWKFEQFIPHRISVLSNGKYGILAQQPKPGAIIYIVNSAGAVEQSFGKLPRQSRMHPVYNESNVVTLQEGSIIHIPLRLGVFITYQNGNLVKGKTTLDGQQFPKIVQRTTENNETFSQLDPDAVYTGYKAAAGEKYVVLEYYNPVSKKSYVDFYESPSLDYKFSLPTPTTFADITITRSELIGLAPEAIYRTEIPK